MKAVCKMIVLCAACACMCMAADSSAASTAQPGGQDMNADRGLTWYQVLMVASLLGGGTALGWQGCKKMNAIRVEPQPLEVKHSAEYVTKHEFESYKGEVRDNFKGVHARINNATITLSEMRGTGRGKQECEPERELQHGAAAARQRTQRHHRRHLPLLRKTHGSNDTRPTLG